MILDKGGLKSDLEIALSTFLNIIQAIYIILMANIILIVKQQLYFQVKNKTEFLHVPLQVNIILEVWVTVIMQKEIKNIQMGRKK